MSHYNSTSISLHIYIYIYIYVTSYIYIEREIHCMFRKISQKMFYKGLELQNDCPGLALTSCKTLNPKVKRLQGWDESRWGSPK